LLFLLLVLLVDLAADPLGADSREGRDRPAWARAPWPSSQCENPVRSLEAFAILLASLNRRFAMERSRWKGAQWIHRCRLQNNWQQRHTQGQALLKWTSLPSTTLPLRKALPCAGGGGWYQSGGSDRMQLVRNFEFLKWLVVTGKLAP